MADFEGGKFPRRYAKIYKPGPDECFLSRHLSKQSDVVNVDDGIRVATVPAKFWEQFSHVKNLKDLFECGLKKSKFLPCLGTRSSTNDPYHWLLYGEVDEKIRAFGSALVNFVGRRPNEYNIVGIYARNSPEWVITQHACAAYSYVYVPLYDTLGSEAMQHILKQTELQVLVCHSAKEASYAIKSFTSSIKHVIIVQRSIGADHLRDEYRNTLNIFYFDEFLEMGSKELQLKKEPRPTDLLTICYTSGSTGIPKGVLVRHEQLVNALMAASCNFEGKFTHQSTVHMCYLPLAHILEQLFSSIVFLAGARAVFLTGGPETLLADIGAAKPTVFCAVPRVLSKIYNEYYKKVPKAKCMRNMLQKCIIQKNKEQTRGKFDHSSVADCLFFKKFRNMLGGQICVIISGGAPLDSEVSKFFRAALSCPVSYFYFP
ncbi:Long-chain-fatty-acid--CoA ligase 5 [Paragonimus heterotremus]|uniref:long-chain-fatty-acid--CoA ligase n=1 Tax=Paragonimus heterotremus TaxID=100268 RepID=A0A8J4WHQ0_9TREM|nr:Long-chain-fatty-acid--CoA ligase 5 [Paragonimus heterotremus]